MRNVTGDLMRCCKVNMDTTSMEGVADVVGVELSSKSMKVMKKEKIKI